MTPATEQKLDRGSVIAALTAFTFWGLVPVYYKGLQAVGAWEVLAHRVIWAVPILLLFLAIRDGGKFWKKLRLPLKSIAWLILSGLTISVNWLVFVWAVANDHVLDTSLGYFGTPVINVLFGYLFGEQFTAGHAVAFTCIWLALVLVSIEPFRRARRRLRA